MQIRCRKNYQNFKTFGCRNSKNFEQTGWTLLVPHSHLLFQRFHFLFCYLPHKFHLLVLLLQIFQQTLFRGQGLLCALFQPQVNLKSIRCQFDQQFFVNLYFCCFYWTNHFLWSNSGMIRSFVQAWNLFLKNFRANVFQPIRKQNFAQFVFVPKMGSRKMVCTSNCCCKLLYTSQQCVKKSKVLCVHPIYFSKSLGKPIRWHLITKILFCSR